MSEGTTLDRTSGGAWRLRAVQLVPVRRDVLFPFFANAENLALITPPNMRFRILTTTPIHMRTGAVIDYRLRVLGLPVGWRTLISEWDPPHGFVDEQLRGPYAEWVHQHRFTEPSDGCTLMEDSIRFRLPFGPVGMVGVPLVRWQLRRIFEYRRAVITARFGAMPG